MQRNYCLKSLYSLTISLLEEKPDIQIQKIFNSRKIYLTKYVI
jgi:hypothetical protein